MFPQMTAARRENLLRGRRDALAAYNRAMDMSQQHAQSSYEETEALTEAARHYTAARQAEAEYFEELPRIPLSCCPFDDRPLFRSFDPFGLDGPWWRGDAKPQEPPACPHFCVLLGALHFGGEEPRAGEFDVRPGPELPYVVPR